MPFKIFCVGVSEYDDDRINNLPFVKTDLDLVQSTFKNHLNLNKGTIEILGKSSKDTTWTNVLNQLKSFLTTTKEDDTLIIYYSGHGTSIDGEGYLICQDTNQDYIHRTSIGIKELNTLLKTASCKNKILFLDSCYSGINIGKSNGSKFVIEGVANLQSEGWSILSSCKGNELSYGTKDGSKSVFTMYLCEAFSGKALTEDSTSLSLSEINSYVVKKVTNYTISNFNLSQTPTLKSERIGELEFAISNLEAIKDQEENLEKPKTSMPDYVSEIRLYHKSQAPTTSYIWKNNVNKEVDIDEDNRTEINTRNRKESLNKVSTELLKFFDPSEIEKAYKPGYNEYSFPLGGYLLKKSKFSYELEFVISHTTDELTDSVMKHFDNQSFINWKKVSFSIKKEIDFNKVKSVCKENNYTIKTYDIEDNSMIIELTTDQEDKINLEVLLYQDSSEFVFFEQQKLRQDFMETLPIISIIERFID